jgi:hypothetical protein
MRKAMVGMQLSLILPIVLRGRRSLSNSIGKKKPEGGFACNKAGSVALGWGRETTELRVLTNGDAETGEWRFDRI